MGVLAASWQLLDLQEEILVTQWSAEEGLGTAAGKKYDALHPVDEQAEIDVKTEIKETPALSFCVIFCYLSAYLGCVPLGCEAQRAAPGGGLKSKGALKRIRIPSYTASRAPSTHRLLKAAQVPEKSVM